MGARYIDVDLDRKAFGISAWRREVPADDRLSHARPFRDYALYFGVDDNARGFEDHVAYSPVTSDTAHCEGEDCSHSA